MQALNKAADSMIATWYILQSGIENFSAIFGLTAGFQLAVDDRRDER